MRIEKLEMDNIWVKLCCDGRDFFNKNYYLYRENNLFPSPSIDTGGTPGPVSGTGSYSGRENMKQYRKGIE
ncbi:hypothetical protein SDC9_149643 [bioreactor metagenome]|jgi:hypothetical protein|uniref:Uncharacterized protein n=1 Tax=bioreactor metagenome TaxID=1076179 RepID=A0A645EKX5_9ZZZZ